MSNFVPLNVEIESDSEYDIDDMKIEEALKLYQNAIKLHSQGPSFYAETEAAYKELFSSEVFRWQESLTEAQRLEDSNDVDGLEDEYEEGLTPLLSAPAVDTDGGPSSLPQILYLAYKNHGLFLLDRLKSDLSHAEDQDDSKTWRGSSEALSNTISSSFKLLVEALHKDDTDLEIWRLVSKIGGVLGSRRIARFCLETVLDNDENSFAASTEPLGLEEGFAEEQIKPLLESLDDHLSKSQLAHLYGRSRDIIAAFRQQLDPCPYLPTPAPSPAGDDTRRLADPQIIKVPSRSWASCGKAILSRLDQEGQGLVEPDPGATYTVDISEDQASKVYLPPPSATIQEDATTETKQIVAVDIENLIGDVPKSASTEGGAVPDQMLSHSIQASPVESVFRTLEDVPKNSTAIEAGDQRVAVGDNDSAIQVAASVDNLPRSAVSVSLPTRKRSSEAAELAEGQDAGRTKSKRIKARGTLSPGSLRDSTADDWARWFEQQLQIYHNADDAAFANVKDILRQLGVEEPLALQTLRYIISSTTSNVQPDHSLGPLALVVYDLKSSLDRWDLMKSKAFLNGHDPTDPAGGLDGNRNPDFAAFLEGSTQDSNQWSKFELLSDSHELGEFERHVSEQKWISLGQIAYQLLDSLLSFSLFFGLDDEVSTLYQTYLWPNALKESVVQLLVYQDHAVYSEINRLIENTNTQAEEGLNHTHSSAASDDPSDWLDTTARAKRKYTHLIQTIFELHVDVYGLITKPSSKVDEATRTLQQERLCRWFALTSKVMNQWSWPGHEGHQQYKVSDQLSIRFLWASVVCKSLLDPASRDDTIICYQDLVQVLKDFFCHQPSSNPPAIELPNNAIMPEISVSIAEKEISKLRTMDFFMDVFDYDSSDPLALIENLEPLLDLSVNYDRYAPSQASMLDEAVGGSTEENSLLTQDGGPPQLRPGPQVLEALQFLEQGSLSLRLFLWQRLRDAYRAISYPPQVLACDLRLMTLIVDYLVSPTHLEKPLQNRRDSLLRWLHRLDDHISRVLSNALNKVDPFECVDSDHIRSALQSLTSLQTLLHVFALWEDTIRVGQTPAPAQVGQNAVKGLAKSTDKFRDMIVKTWVLQYTLLKEAIIQFASVFTYQEQQLVIHLQKVHQALGLRFYCSLASKMFLKNMKNEIERFKLAGDWDSNMCQLMYDLYGVKVSSNVMEMQDHGCHTEDLDKSTALEIMDLVMTQVNRISIKDLLKSDLKFTVDKMQQVIKIPPISKSASRQLNFRLVNNYLKSPLNPYNLYRSLRGIGGLCGSPVHDEYSDVASKGWYFLLGNIAFVKFRSTKRSSALSTDELSIARTFFRHDLEFSTNRWETWYRLGQVYDATLEEEITWTADKLDHQGDHIADLQRKVILCYSMAITIATQCAEGSFEDTSMIADLCADFGTRVYASTREPFSMKAFSLDDHKRHYNSRASGMYQGPPFKSMQIYSAWKLASILLRRASVQKPQNWVIAYTLGKVLWKMHNCEDEVRGMAKIVSYQPVIETFVRAIQACPDKRDSRHPDKDPILEPHYKLLATVHKLVKSRRVVPEEGCRILKATPYSRKVSDFQESGDWNGYVWQILKALRAADKANWHHRMVARAAHILYDDDPSDPRSALGAKHELNQQMFTKTMALQVWKPDNERPGRHFVYTNRYVRFFTRLLYQLNDKVSMETLTRRIRKRASDYVNHSGVWEEVCLAYLKLLHHQPGCSVTDGYSELIFQGMDPENFQAHAARLETFIHSQDPAPPMVGILREAVELKRLNQNLLKPLNPFEDLIRDAYAHLYETIVPGLIAKDAAEERRIRMSVDNMLMNPEPPAVETPPPDAAGEAPRKSGAKYITAREIVRKAEAIASKPAPTVPAKVLKALAPAPGSEQDARPPENAPRIAVVINTDGNIDGGSSVPGSVHDSADDESELSEVDDEVGEGRSAPVVPVRKPLFPGLLGATADNPQEIDGDTNDERGGDGGDEEDEQEVDDESRAPEPVEGN